MDNFWFALILTTFAGLSTGIGAAIAFFYKEPNKALVTASLGLSAGVMLYVSFVEMLKHSFEIFNESYPTYGSSYTVFFFFGGMLIILLIDKFVPSFENPHEPNFSISDYSDNIEEQRRMKKIGIMTALAIGIHNFPEGMATFASVTYDLDVGIGIAVAIAIHNIPEGIAVSVPIFYATGSKKQAFWFSFTSGLSEPVGAVLAALVLQQFLSESMMAAMFAAIAGIMVFISLDELLPTAHSFDDGHKAMYYVILGMAIMAVSLLVI